MRKEKFKYNVIFIIIFIVLLISSKSYAVEINKLELQETEYTEEYKNWLNLPEEEKAKTIMPRTIEIKDNNLKQNVSMHRQIVSSALVPRAFDLRDKINMTIKNQGTSGICWTFATLGSLESNLQLTKGVTLDLSERHMDYATSNSFTTENENGCNRQVNTGANDIIAYSYLSNGSGAILEEEMPFSNDFETKDISYIQGKNVVTKVEDTAEFPAITKETPILEKQKIMRKIKQHIMNYGAVYATVNGEAMKEKSNYYNNSTFASFYDGDILSNHAIMIIGWDDDFKKENFNSKHMPTSDGAWIIKNSWGSLWGDNGYGYVSYEDVLIGKEISGIEKSTDQIDYSKIYQHDGRGSFAYHTFNDERLYEIEVFERDTAKKEQLTQIGLRLNQDTYCKVYVNTKNDNKSISNFIEATKEYTLCQAGYHTINLDSPLELTQDKFTVAVEYYVPGGIAVMRVESTKVETTKNIKPVEGQGFLTDKLYNTNTALYDLASLGSIGTVKAFIAKESGNPTISSNKYEIEENYINKIEPKTTIENFTNNLTIDGEIKIYNKKQEVKNTKELIKTGMSIKVSKEGSKEINLHAIITGDVSGDGLVQADDLADTVKAVLGDIELSEIQFKAIDMNDNSKIEADDLADEVKLVLN